MTELLDIVQKFGEDVAVPENPESEGSRLITLKQIELEHGVSRSALHTYRRSASFPQPVPVEGSTKIQYRADDVAAWFDANSPQQGKRTDLAKKQQQGDPVTTTESPTVIVSVIDPQPPKYTHADVDGDRLLITTADIPGVGKGVYFKTDPNGSSVPLAEVPALIEKLKEIAAAAGEQS